MLLQDVLLPVVKLVEALGCLVFLALVIEGVSFFDIVFEAEVQGFGIGGTELEFVLLRRLLEDRVLGLGLFRRLFLLLVYENEQLGPIYPIVRLFRKHPPEQGLNLLRNWVDIEGDLQLVLPENAD